MAGVAGEPTVPPFASNLLRNMLVTVSALMGWPHKWKKNKSLHLMCVLIRVVDTSRWDKQNLIVFFQTPTITFTVLT